MTHDVRTVASSLCHTYDTHDPFEIARQKHIKVFYEPLGTIRGYYNVVFRQHMIHINEALPPEEQLKVCAHELGHAILHAKTNTAFLTQNTYISVSKMEWEANCFMSMLVFADDELYDLRECNMGQLEYLLGIPAELIRWRYDQIQA